MFVAFVVKLLFACVTVLRERPRCLACPLHYGFARARRNLSSRVYVSPRNCYGLVKALDLAVPENIAFTISHETWKAPRDSVRRWGLRPPDGTGFAELKNSGIMIMFQFGCLKYHCNAVATAL